MPGALAPEIPETPETLLARLRSLRALDVEVALRASLAVAIPLIVLIIAGRIDWTAYASFGAMTALYGRGEPYRLRARTITIAGAFLLGSIALALGVAVAGLPLLVGGLLLVVIGGILVATTAGLVPGTPLFFVFAFSVCAQLPTPPGEVGERMLVAVAAAVLAWLLTMSGWGLRRMFEPHSTGLFKDLPRAPRLRPATYRDPQVWLVILQNVVGVLLAGGLAMIVGIGHPYWAVVAVVAVLPPPRAAHSISRAVHRVVGTALGVVVTGLVLLPGPSVAWLVVVITVSQFGAEILVGKHYGAALLFITPLALSVVHLGSPVPVPALLVDRVVETALGAGVAILLVLLFRFGAGAAAQRRERRGPTEAPSGS
ncbi:FUSC family protein [Cryobacterium zhongshanensis]|uniref:FUSC family protein n=1 Tax=Cryobacterium zhongshanensis TaxID=2928153 RepID=A0AA41UJ30_9MICO|nr:FUSC family protein [Cryobacterium zhongshanensis]MCI4656556.1 FUSC family protein [Cryobacterium zhongshanensis]